MHCNFSQSGLELLQRCSVASLTLMQACSWASRALILLFSKSSSQRVCGRKRKCVFVCVSVKEIERTTEERVFSFCTYTASCLITASLAFRYKQTTFIIYNSWLIATVYWPLKKNIEVVMSSKWKNGKVWMRGEFEALQKRKQTPLLCLHCSPFCVCELEKEPFLFCWNDHEFQNVFVFGLSHFALITTALELYELHKTW